jgi:integrase/recombinase XerD
MSDLDLYMEKYLEHLVVLNFSPVTVRNHRYILRPLRAYLEEMGLSEVQKVTAEALRDYQSSLVERVNYRGEPISVFSQNHLLKAAKCFFRFLCEENYLLSDPAKGLRYAKVPRMLPRSILTIQEMRKLLEAPDTRTALGYRDRTILELMYSTGLRKSEVNHLKVMDVDAVDGFVRVNEGKGHKDRVVPLGKIACRWVENYVKAVRPMLLGVRGQTHAYLFVTSRGYPFSVSAVWGLVKRHARKAGLEKRVVPHTLRHTCATLMMKNRANVRHIQELLGHNSLESTQIYTQVSVVDLKDAHKKYHPRERERVNDPRANGPERGTV